MGGFLGAEDFLRTGGLYIVDGRVYECVQTPRIAPNGNDVSVLAAESSGRLLFKAVAVDIVEKTWRECDASGEYKTTSKIVLIYDLDIQSNVLTSYDNPHHCIIRELYSVAL